MPRGIERPSPEPPERIRRLLERQRRSSPRIRAAPLALPRLDPALLRFLLVSAGMVLLLLLLALGFRPR